MFDRISRVYRSDLAQSALDWRPTVDFKYVLACLKSEKDYRSQLSLDVGIKGYHSEAFNIGPYPV